MVKAAAGITTGVALTAGLTVGSAVLAPETAGAAVSCKAPNHITTLNVTAKTAKSSAASVSSQIAASCLRAAGHSATVGGTKAFQKSVGLAQTGVVDRATWSALLSRGSTPRLHDGSTGSAVTRLQGGLKALGYQTPVNGKFGTTTKRAVQALQKKEHWSRTGIAGGGTWYVLQHGGRWTAPKHASYSAHVSSSSSSSRGERALAYAKAQLGDPYRYGAAGPNAFDCSGLAMAAWRSAGVSLPHQTGAMYRAVGHKVSKSQLQPGDLVFFYSGRSHVAIYAGNGMVIHAPHGGAVVSYIKMKYMPYNGAVRPS